MPVGSTRHRHPRLYQEPVAFSQEEPGFLSVELGALLSFPPAVSPEALSLRAA